MKPSVRRIGVCYSLAAVVSVAACVGGSSPTSPGPTNSDGSTPRRAVVLGDSLSVSPSRTEGFPAELERRMNAQQPSWIVSNAGVSGDTTTGGLRRFDQAVPDGTQILILELGANDGLRGVDIETVERNLSTMIERARSRAIRVLLCGMEIPPIHGWNYTVDFHQLFPRVARKYNLPLVPFLLEGVVLNPDLNGDDEIHPNAAGAQRIAETVWPYLQPMIVVGSGLQTRPLFR
jgi:acyl-CoA thioesterase-1